MRDYWIKTPGWLPWLYPNRVWRMPVQEKTIYLTFDDGPHPEITPFVLDQLRQYEAKAHFFCIGQNVDHNPETFASIQAHGHGIGNHTQHHVNGWKTSQADYLNDVQLAADRIDSNWFRPPYGRLRSQQARSILSHFPKMCIAMWDVLSGDFDRFREGEDCARLVAGYAESGSIVVMHDSEKAWDRLKICLPKTLEFFHKKGFRFEKLPDR